MKRKVLFPLFGKKDLPAGIKLVLFLLVVFLWSGNTFSQNWNQIIKTVAADRTSGVHVGSSVAISGDYAIVGAPQDGSGSAYIFQRVGANWIQMQKIVASDADSDDNFGTSVAISGDYVVVGAVYDNGDATNTNPLSDAGSAYVFKRTGATWAQEQKIVASDRQAFDYFGLSVAISGDYVVVGSLLQNLDASGASPISDAGAAYIYKRTGTSWAQEQKIVASVRLNDDNFGYSVAISGDYVVVGATGEDENAAEASTVGEAGAAYVFFRTGTTWTQQQKIVASDRASNDNFAYSVSISGDYVIIGVPNEDEDATGGNTATNAGSAYIFTRTGATWAQQQKIVASDRAANDNFAYSVSISGDYAIIGSLYEDENVSGTATLSGAGSAYIISRSGTTWSQIDKIVASDRAADDNFARSVAISGDYAIAGAPYEDEDGAGANTLTDPGSVYFFKNCGTVTGTTSVTNVSCNSGTNGTINLTPSGGTPGYTFSWGGGVTTEDRTGLTAGTYTVTITDATGCRGIVAGITVTQPTAVSVTPNSQTNIACFGSNTGSATVNAASGGTSPYTYDWTPGTPTGDGTTTITGLTAGTWTCTVSDNNGCTATRNFTITQVAAIVVTPNTQTNVSCFGGSNGAAAINTPTGGLGGYSYNWTPGNPTGDGSVSVTGLTAQTYTCTVTDGLGCSKTQTFNLTAPPNLTGSTVVTNVACNGGTNGAINLTPSGGAGGYTFSWGGGVTTEDRTGLAAGTYSVTITDANACTRLVSGITVTQATAVSGSTVVTNVACFGNSTGAVNLTPTGGTPGYTFSWGGGVTSEDRISLTAGTYSVTITDANGCTGTVSPTVTQPTAVVSGTRVVTNVSCFGGTNGAINLTPTGGVGPYTFNWVGGATTEDRTGLVAGTYSVTITDANACTGTVSGITVTQPTAAVSGTTVVTNVACNTGTNGAINLTPTGGTGPYTFNWVGGATTEDRTGLAAGTYSVTITDNNGCTGTVSGITVTQPTAISLTASSQTNVSCNGGSNGAAAVNNANGGTPGYTYNWTPGTPTGDGTTSITGLTAGTWTCTVTDANGCVASQSFTVTQPTAISMTAAAQTNVACNGGATGSFTVNPAIGGAGSFTYDWAPGTPAGDGTTTVTGLTAGTYSVTTTDANSCTATINFTITQPTALSVTPASQTNIACNGGATGAAAINTPTGGTPGYTYNWSPGTPTGDGTISVTGLTAGTWTVNVTDANGCAVSQSFTVTQPTAISVTASAQTNVACNGGSNGAASINTPTGGTPGYTYDWAPGTPTGDGTVSVNGLTAGTYTVTATDANGCAASQSFTVTQPTAISVIPASQTNLACNGGATGAAAINTPTGGTPGYTYDWTPGTPTGDGSTSVTGLTAGTWTVNLMDANGCMASQSFTVTQPAAITSTVAATSCDSYTLNGTTYNTSGTYTQVLTSVSGCDSTLTLNLTINNSTTETLNATSCSSYTLNGTTYTTSGTYTQLLTNAVGCDSTITLNLVINQPTSATLTDTACIDYTLNGTTYNTSGTYSQLLMNAAGCDSTITLILTINMPTVSTLTETSCDSYTLNGSTYTTSGVYTQVIENAAGCDSTITLNLTINNSSASTLIEAACESYTLNGQTYTVSGTYTQLLTNSVGCDSILTLALTINSTDADTTTVTACGSYLWNGQTFTISGFYTLSFTNANGCDSIENLDLTILPSPVAGITSLSVISLQASGTGTYQWINCSNGQPISGATNATFTATSNGSYAVIVSNGSCSDTSSCVVISQVGLDENSASLGVTLTPNPAQNDVKITFTGTNEASIVIYDAQGKSVMTADHVQSGEMLSVEAFERGVYMVHIVTTSGNHTERLVKQ